MRLPQGLPWSVASGTRSSPDPLTSSPGTSHGCSRLSQGLPRVGPPILGGTIDDDQHDATPATHTVPLTPCVFHALWVRGTENRVRGRAVGPGSFASASGSPSHRAPRPPRLRRPRRGPIPASDRGPATGRGPRGRPPQGSPSTKGPAARQSHQRSRLQRTPTTLRACLDCASSRQPGEGPGGSRGPQHPSLSTPAHPGAPAVAPSVPANSPEPLMAGHIRPGIQRLACHSPPPPDTQALSVVLPLWAWGSPMIWPGHFSHVALVSVTSGAGVGLLADACCEISTA